MNVIQSINSSVDPYLQLLNSPIGSMFLHLISFLYIVPGVARLPPVLKSVLNFQIFRSAVMAILIWMVTKNAVLSIVISIAFLLVAQALFPSIIETFAGPQTVVMPGCLSYRIHDLLESFGNNKKQLLEAMFYSGIPDTMTLSDDNAGLIATYLINNGYELKPTTPCKAPE